MGQGKPAIPEEVYICSYNKYSFNDKLDVIRDAHDVSQYYANLLLLERLPIKLDLYKNYSDHTEEYFNPTRKNVLTDLGMSYYNFYQYINSVPELYEKTDMAEKDRRKLLTDIFKRKILASDFSQYLHIPTITDSDLAPKDHHAAYTLIPVPHNGSGIDWSIEGPKLTNTVLKFLDEEGYIPDLMSNLVHSEFITPDYFEDTLNSHLGNSFGVEPRLTQSAFFRPHNRSEDINGLYLVGASSQPGAGTPSVMMSAKMTARAIADDFSETIDKWRNDS